ncbi:MAG: hypothetical protein OXL41_15535 [Nitrospinae bacterium]|nr:hypothetical protein [Nitrospinota bacterium]
MADPTTDRLSDPFQIGRASRYANPEFEDQSLPVVYGDLTTPSRRNTGVYALAKIDTADGGVYCVAAHEVWGAVALFDDDGRIAPENYTLELSRNYQGRGAIAAAAFSAPPKGRVTAVCKGRKNESGALIENPAEVVYDLMTSVWGFSEQDIDMQSLSRATTSAKALGYRASGIILDDHAPADVLTSLLGDFLGRYEIDPFGRLKIHIAGEEPFAISPQKVLPRFGHSRIESEMARDTVINQVPVLYASDYLGARYIKHDDGSATQNTSSQRLYGVRRPPRSPLRLEWVRRESVAATVQARIVKRYHEPTRMLTIEDGSLRALEVEPDDYVAFSVPWMRSKELEPLVNQIGEVIEVNYDLGEQSMELKIRDTGFFLTSSCLLDGSKTLEGGWLLGAERDAATYA